LKNHFFCKDPSLLSRIEGLCQVEPSHHKGIPFSVKHVFHGENVVCFQDKAAIGKMLWFVAQK